VTDAPTRFDPAAIFDALARHNVEYVTVGGIAIQAHGGQRLTQDLDVRTSRTSGCSNRLTTDRRRARAAIGLIRPWLRRSQPI